MKTLRKIAEWIPAIAIPVLVWGLILAAVWLLSSCAWAWGEAYRIRGGYYQTTSSTSSK